MLESHSVDLPLAPERKSVAVALLSYVRAQTATWQIYKDKAAQLQAEIETTLPADLRTAAIARGQTSTVEVMVNVLLAVLGTG